jgi:hypothetical protein
LWQPVCGGVDHEPDKPVLVGVLFDIVRGGLPVLPRPTKVPQPGARPGPWVAGPSHPRDCPERAVDRDPCHRVVRLEIAVVCLEVLNASGRGEREPANNASLTEFALDLLWSARVRLSLGLVRL